MAIILQQKLRNIAMTIANNLQEKCDQTSKITANPTVDTLKRAICAMWKLPLLEKWNQMRSIDTNSTATAETLKRVLFAVWDFLVALFNQAFFLWQARDEHFPHRFQGAPPYLKADYVKQKWNQMDAEYKLTNTVGEIFAQFLSAVANFYGYLIRSFNNILPPETRDEQIRHWLHVGAHYLIAAVVLIMCIRCFICLCSCLGSIFSCFFMFYYSIVRFLFSCISSIVKDCFYAVCTIFWCLRQCLPCRGRSAGKMMKAPGRPAMMIARGVFEGNPRGYFSNLRGKR